MVPYEPRNSETLDLRADSSSIHTDSELELPDKIKTKSKRQLWTRCSCFDVSLLLFVTLFLPRCLRIECKQGQSKWKNTSNTRGILQSHHFLCYTSVYLTARYLFL